MSIPFPSNQRRIVLSALLAVAVIAGCSSVKSGAPTSSDAAWTEARAKFLDGDYLEASHLLDILKLQYSGGAHADSVQYLLGECNFHEGKYLLAAYEFGGVRRSYPSSPLVRSAQFRIAESYYAMAPPAAIDQDNSRKAIEEYQTFLELYGKPTGYGDTLSTLASTRIKELRNRGGKKYYDTAILYFKMSQFKAADVYCDLVQEKYYDTDYGELAGLLKIKVLIELRRYNEARHEAEKFLTTYRASTLVPEVRALRESIETKGVPQQ